jgi:endothelin-converting enzyme
MVYFNHEKSIYNKYIYIVNHFDSLYRFDNAGGQFDENGTLADALSGMTRRNFNALSVCFIKQYDNFVIPELIGYLRDPSVNGNLTLGENIADNGGIRQGGRHIPDN